MFLRLHAGELCLIFQGLPDLFQRSPMGMRNYIYLGLSVEGPHTLAFAHQESSLFSIWVALLVLSGILYNHITTLPYFGCVLFLRLPIGGCASTHGTRRRGGRWRGGFVAKVIFNEAWPSLDYYWEVVECLGLEEGLGSCQSMKKYFSTSTF